MTERDVITKGESGLRTFETPNRHKKDNEENKNIAFSPHKLKKIVENALPTVTKDIRKQESKKSVEKSTDEAVLHMRDKIIKSH